MPLDTPTLQAQLVATFTGAALEGGTPSFPLNLTWAAPLVTGVGANQADKVYAANLVLAISGGQDIDLAGVLLDPFGAALTFVKLKAILIKASPLNTNNVLVSRPATNGVTWLSTVSTNVALGPGGILLLVNPSAAGIATVTPGTADILRVDNSGAGTTVALDVILIGTSA